MHGIPIPTQTVVIVAQRKLRRKSELLTFSLVLDFSLRNFQAPLLKDLVKDGCMNALFLSVSLHHLSPSLLYFQRSLWGMQIFLGQQPCPAASSVEKILQHD